MKRINSAKIMAFAETAKHFNKFLPAEILSYLCGIVTEYETRMRDIKEICGICEISVRILNYNITFLPLAMQTTFLN